MRGFSTKRKEVSEGWARKESKELTQELRHRLLGEGLAVHGHKICERWLGLFLVLGRRVYEKIERVVRGGLSEEGGIRTPLISGFVRTQNRTQFAQHM